MATVVFYDNDKERLIMPVAGATSPSFNMPSIGRTFEFLSKALVGFAVAFSGISNARPIVSRAQQHGGGLRTEAQAHWQSDWEPGFQACLSKPSTLHFGPDRIIADCRLQGVADWLRSNEDSDAPLVVSRILRHHKLLAKPVVSTTQKLTPDKLKEIMDEVEGVMSTNEGYDDIMEQTKSLLELFLLSPHLEKLNDPTQRYTADRLIGILDHGLGLDPFKAEVKSLSIKLHGMASAAAQDIYRLAPKRISSSRDRKAVNARVNENFVSRGAGNAEISEPQLRTLLSLLAQHMNEKNSQWTA